MRLVANLPIGKHSNNNNNNNNNNRNPVTLNLESIQSALRSILKFHLIS